jgi:hypothetical protein
MILSINQYNRTFDHVFKLSYFILSSLLSIYSPYKYLILLIMLSIFNSYKLVLALLSYMRQPTIFNVIKQFTTNNITKMLIF